MVAVPDDPPEFVTSPALADPPLAADVPPVLELAFALLPPLLVVNPPVLLGLLSPLLVAIPPVLPVVPPPLLVVVPLLTPPVDPGPEPPTGAALPPDEKLPPGSAPGVVSLQEHPHTTTPHRISFGQAVFRILFLAYPTRSVCVDHVVENRRHDT